MTAGDAPKAIDAAGPDDAAVEQPAAEPVEQERTKEEP